tara:strand:- start:5833 stop:6192 length:360 start_codon:yes stop_codon:yes gene_type:complete
MGDNTMSADEAWVAKLQDSLTEIKILAAGVDTKLDSLSLSVQKLEAGFEELKSVTNSQETRLALLEAKLENCSQMIPENLVEDFTLIKARSRSYQKFLWMTSSVVVGLVIKTLFDMMTI